jgi:outer membrane protein assembly factor BamB
MKHTSLPLRLRFLVRTCALLLLAGAGTPSFWAADQPQWGQRHSRNMVSAERGLPTSFDPKSGRHVRWVADLGTSTYSTPVVARGRVLIGTNNSQPRNPRHQGDRAVLMCFDEPSGRLIWQLVVPKLPKDPYLDCPGVGLTSSPAVEGDRVYLVNNRAEVMCLDLHGLSNGNDGPYQDESRHAAPLGFEPVALGDLDADILWVTDLRREVDAYPHDSANISVLVQGDHLYVSTPSGVDHTHRHRPSPHAPGLVVLDKHSGRLIARDDTGIGARIFHSIFSSPSFGVVNERSLVFYGGGDGVVYAFEALAAGAAVPSSARSSADPSGREMSFLKAVWSFDCDPAAPKENISQYQGNRRESPSSIVGMSVIYHNRIYVAVGGDPWHGKRECWLKCIDATLTGDVTRTAALWSYPLVRHCISTPSVADGLVFIADMGRMLHCVDARTGQAYWTHELDGEVWGSTLVAEGKLYVGTHRGTLWVLQAGREKRVIGSAQMGDPIHTTPIAANGVLYVATMTRLYALAVPPGTP